MNYEDEIFILLNGIHTIELALVKAKAEEATQLWFRKQNLMQCLYKIMYEHVIVNG
jgi:hypothetical protein